jgi:hypothetical protein
MIELLQELQRLLDLDWQPRSLFTGKGTKVADGPSELVGDTSCSHCEIRSRSAECAVAPKRQVEDIQADVYDGALKGLCS